MHFRFIASCVLVAFVATAGFRSPAVAGQQPSDAAPTGAQAADALADPAIAETLKLSDEQRTQLAALLTERAEGLAKAEPDQREAVSRQFGEKFLALLSDAQRTQLATMADGGAEERTLRFNFRFQRWSDVLEWFAEQAGLSLVLDAPPPGTFNYSDQRAYTVPESLDLLNGVLLTKGYTLVRRDRMLILVDLSQGIPETLVPRITLEDLDKRGRFEWVSVMFPVDNRSAEEVIAEIAPLLSPRGKSQALPKTKQVLVTDTAGVMRAVSAVIESIPQPKAPAPGAPPEKPNLVVYPLTLADPDAAVEVLKALLPGAQFVRDPKANQLSAYATPSQHSAIKGVLDQMQSTAGGGEGQSRFEVYQLNDVDPDAALATLQPLVPAARLSIDSASKKLAAWGTPADHDILKKAVSQLAGASLSSDDRQVEVYRLANADPASVATMLKSVVPQARVAVDVPTKSLVVLAGLADQETVRAIVEQIDSKNPAAGTPELRIYPVDQTPPDTLTSLLQQLIPTATVTADSDRRRLSVVATPTDHETIKAAIDEYVKATPARSPRRLVLYPVSAAERQRFQTVVEDLRAEFPNVKVITDAEPGELAVWATSEEHDVIADIVKQLKQESPAEASYQLVAYSIRVADPSSILTVLQDLYPATKFVLDSKTRRLVAWTRPEEQQSIKSLIDQMDTDEAGETQFKLMVYPASGFDPSAAISTLNTIVPDATLTQDTTAKTIVAWARGSDHEQIAATLDQLRPGADPTMRPHVVSYSVGTASASTIAPLITTLVPAARVAPNDASHTIAIWATPVEHETIRGAIEEMVADQTKAAGQVISYSVGTATASTLAPLITTLVPAARIAPNDASHSIAIWATPEEHQTIKTAIEEMIADQPEVAGKVVAYSVGDAVPSSISPMITTLAPTARVAPNNATKTIAVWASPKDHETIRVAIDEMTGAKSEATTAKVVVYSLKETLASNITSALQTAVPEARVGLGQNPRKIVVWARPSEHEIVRETLKQLDTEEQIGEDTVLKAYPVNAAGGGNVLNTLQGLFRNHSTVRLSYDADNRKIVAIATDKEHASIKRVIDEIEHGSPVDADAEFEVHPLRDADASIVMQVLNSRLGKDSQAVLSTDADGQQLVAVATPEQQEQIRETIDQLQAAGRDLEVFPLDVVDPFTAELAIEKLFSEGGRRNRRGAAPIVESDVTASRLYIRATREDLDEIRNLLVKMGETRLANSDGSGGNVRIIPFSGDARATLAEIERIWPQLSDSPLRVLTSPAKRRRPLQPQPTSPSTDDSGQDTIEQETDANPTETVPVRRRQSSRDKTSPALEVKTAAVQDQSPPPVEPNQPPPAEKKDEPTAKAPPATKEPAPIIVSPGEDRITIMSDDPEAIKQFEALVRSLTPPAGAGGRAVTVYPLRSADSTAVADLLQRIFRRGAFDFGDSSSPVIEAEQRLNAIVVYAGRNDRAVIEQLLEVIDSDEVPDSLVANRPTMIPVKNTDAEAVEDVLRDIYQTQLTSGARRPQIPVPSGASRDVAAVIQQINTAATGPLMTLGVDDTTNSIVVMAPAPLVEEVSELVAKLDEAALNDTSRSVKVVKLRNASAMQVQEVLEDLIRNSAQGRSGRRRDRR